MIQLREYPLCFVVTVGEEFLGLVVLVTLKKLHLEFLWQGTCVEFVPLQCKADAHWRRGGLEFTHALESDSYRDCTILGNP